MRMLVTPAVTNRSQTCWAAVAGLGEVRCGRWRVQLHPTPPPERIFALVPKERVVAAFPEAVLSASLLISPSDREIIGGCQLLINNCPFANPRPDEAITLRAKSVKQSLEPAALDDSEAFGLKT